MAYMRSRWLVIASFFVLMDAGCAESALFDDPQGTGTLDELDTESLVPPPELAQTEYEVTVDLETGTLKKKYMIPRVRWMYSQPGYNETTGEHTFVGMWERGQSPIFLYTYNRAGARIASPEIPFPTSISAMHYSRSTGILYGIIVRDGKYSLAQIDRNTGVPSIIQEITEAAALGDFTIDEANQRLYASGVDTERVVWTIDLHTGKVLQRAPSQTYGLAYDNASRTLFALESVTDVVTYESSFTLCALNPATGGLTRLHPISGVSGLGMDRPAINENDTVYMFVGIDKTPQSYIFSVNAATGTVKKTPIPTGGVLERHNTAFPHYDNKRKKLYAMYWQAAVPTPPVIGLVP